MTIFPARYAFVFGLWLVLATFTTPVCAQLVDNGPADTSDHSDREASFLPLATTTPSVAPPATQPPVAIAPRLSVLPSAASVVAPPAQATSLPTVSPNVSPVPMPAAVAPTPAKPVDLGKPVEAGTLDDIRPESIGLLSQADGGLGAALWKGTPRSFVERLLPALTLPTPSPTLNNLAQRFLLTTASIPDGNPGSSQTLTAMRVEKLIMLGDAEDAWKLAMLAKADQVDEITLRLTAEAALLSGARNDVCARLPDIMKSHNSAEWQKLMLVCQLMAKDTKAAQVTLDLLHAQNVDDESYLSLVEKNILSSSKQLPRRLTPLRPLTLALLRMVDLPLPGEVFAHPDASLIPELLLAKAQEENARLNLAEHAAERGILTSTDLEATYSSIPFTADTLARSATSTEKFLPRLHALLYQVAMKEQTPQRRIDLAAQFMANASPSLLNGAAAHVLVDMVGAQQPGENFYSSSITMVRIYMLAGKGDAALEWLKLAKRGAIGMPAVEADLQSIWPLLSLAGLESDKDYTHDCASWLDAMLKPKDLKGVDPKTTDKTDAHAQREQAASILLLLDAVGFVVPDESWAKVIDAPVFEKHLIPSALLPQRLRAAGINNHRGETVLLGLLLTGGEASLANTVETIRALRLVGLTADAAMLARETASALIMPQLTSVVSAPTPSSTGSLPAAPSPAIPSPSSTAAPLAVPPTSAAAKP